ncbi:type II secretion system F family protein [Cutibacterium sp. V947]|uniref:type II secretion system F family protein n=1 Tax=unclassified Cutibacterium TaxID=2649671 RepID=UPI003EE2EEB1
MGRVLIAAMLMAAAAVWLVIPPAVDIRTERRTPLPAWLAPRSGAPGPEVRVVAGLVTGCAVMAAVPWSVSVAVAVAVLAGAVVWWGSGQLESSAHRREEQRRAAQLPETLMMLSSAMEAGLPLRSAVRTVAESVEGPCAEDLNRLASSLAAGVPDSTAWSTLASVPVWRDPAQDVSRAVDSGEGISELLSAHAAQLQTAAAEQAEKKARKAGVDAIGPLVCCHLPAFLLVGVVPIIAGMVLGVL